MSIRSERLDVGVEITNPNAELAVIVREILRHALRQRGAEDALVLRRAIANLGEQIVDLARDGAHFDVRVHQTGRPNDLFDEDALRLFDLVFAGRRRDVKKATMNVAFELVEFERAVVERARKAESVFDQGLFARAVAAIHCADLRHGLVRLVEDEQEVLREIIDQRRRRLAFFSRRQMA